MENTNSLLLSCRILEYSRQFEFAEFTGFCALRKQRPLTRLVF
jgi:hypothetical protein